VALRRSLPEEVSPAQVRGALTAVVNRTLDAAGTFDGDGWLRIGLCGHQPGVGETYISTGSLYLCAVAFLPLGLPSSDPFWASPSQPWTSAKAWSGQANSDRPRAGVGRWRTALIQACDRRKISAGFRKPNFVGSL
jgi:hypothetical protein